MKKTKLLKLLTIGSLSTIAATTPLITTLTSCNEPTTTNANSKEVTASDGNTKITLLNNTYKLKNKLNSQSIQELNSIENNSNVFLMCSNVSLMLNSETHKLDEYHTTTFTKKYNTMFILENDFLDFLKLFKINDKNISTEKKTEHLDYISNPYAIISLIDKTTWIKFEFKNLKVITAEKKLSFTLLIQSINAINVSVNHNSLSTNLWTADLGEFTFTNAME